MKRLGFKKSRKGCIRCKQRRVKCDENMPCSACVRHAVPCSLSTPLDGIHTKETTNEMSVITHRRSRNIDSPPQPSSAVMKLSRPADEQDQDGAPTEHNLLVESCVQTVPRWPTLDVMGVQALELMHHYTAVAHRTLAYHDPIADVLLHDIPQEALSCSFLLTHLLAFAGFHKAYLQPSRRHSYFLSASSHQAQALNDMRQTLIEPITPRNCHALYASAIFVVVSTFGKLPSYEIHSHGFDPLDRLLEIFVLIDGMGIILNSSNEHLRAGPLRALFAKPGAKSTLSAHLSILSSQLPVLRSKLCQDTDDWEDDTMTVIEAIDTLVVSVNTVQKANTLTASAELRTAFLWPIMVSNQYLILAQTRHPMALVVLAYYCVLLRLAEAYYWFLKGWAGTVMTEISQELQDTPWADLLSWPLQVILYHH